MSNQEIYSFIKKSGCCQICCLRFLKARGNEYEDPITTLQKLGIEDETDGSANINKKLKTNTCVACLDLFSQQFLDTIIEKIANHADLENIQCNNFVIALSFPILLHIRQFSLWLALIKQFGGSINSSKPPDVPIKEAVKLVLIPKLCQKLNKTYHQNGLMISISLEHSDEGSEVSKLLAVDKALFRENASNSRGTKGEITRGYFERKYLPYNVDLDIYSKQISIPPLVPSSGLKIEKITITGPTVFVAGKYRKLSRKLSHSPWILHGKRIMDESIQEIIVRNISPYFQVPECKIIFSSSGREDVDVRCVGKGRPFVLEIPGANRIILPKNIAASMEEAIEDSFKVSVRNLQMVEREELVQLKAGEEKKKKFYRALCILKEPVTIEMIRKMNIPSGFMTEQITPIRVLHRRPLHKRSRMIYSLKGRVDKHNPKIIVLDITTQAGTYVKELVHGEFGRTVPSISSIVGKWIDIIALDVTGIDLEWPPERV